VVSGEAEQERRQRHVEDGGPTAWSGVRPLLLRAVGVDGSSKRQPMWRRRVEEHRRRGSSSEWHARAVTAGGKRAGRRWWRLAAMIAGWARLSVVRVKKWVRVGRVRPHACRYWANLRRSEANYHKLSLIFVGQRSVIVN
jgi:hypothetical protein